jgi:transposase
MTNPPNRIEVVTSVQRRRRWTASEKVRMVEETFGKHPVRIALRS